tara:strand:+ start:23025 stop:23711 length:687 start_codon:yes stop_codon:yes gene_type:complete
MYKYLLLILIILTGCKEKKLEKSNEILKTPKNFKQSTSSNSTNEKLLNDKNVIPFLNEYGKKNKENKIKILTKYGEIEIKLYEETKYHRANFIFLIKKKYFDNTLFHRVVKDFIIQGGNSDNQKISSKRRKIGKYLLPPDTKKGFKHKRGTISMPSSEIENPHKLASPYEFFIVVAKNGAPHLNGNYTAFGEVTKGMDVADKISNLKVDKREMPINNIFMSIEIIYNK